MIFDDNTWLWILGLIAAWLLLLLLLFLIEAMYSNRNVKRLLALRNEELRSWRESYIGAVQKLESRAGRPYHQESEKETTMEWLRRTR